LSEIEVDLSVMHTSDVYHTLLKSRTSRLCNCLCPT